MFFQFPLFCFEFILIYAISLCFFRFMYLLNRTLFNVKLSFIWFLTVNLVARKYDLVMSLFSNIISSVKEKLKTLSFRTGVIVLLLCVPFYIISFAQMGLDCLSPSAKTVLWVLFFGLAKTFQYSGITILGVEGVKRLKQKFSRKK